MNKKECPICSNPANVSSLDPLDQMFKVKCRICGEYRISHEADRFAPQIREKPHILSGIIRNRSEQGEKVSITTENIQTLLDSVSIPTDPFETIDLLLKHLFRKAGSSGSFVTLDATLDYPLLYAKNRDVFQYYLEKALELEYIEMESEEFGPKWTCRLSLPGWHRIAELKKTERKSDQAFVAMWFDKSLDEAWEEGFRAALKDTGYNAIRIDLTEHNEKICDRIIAEIRKSGLVIADFTGQRGGVYFEAGFAMGLGIPVIWTCRDTDADNLHFDTRQYNHVVWSSPSGLRKALINRIEATMPYK